MFCDLALAYDPISRACDLLIADDGDLGFDVTAETPLLMSLGLDRRAMESDELPDGKANNSQTLNFHRRRGTPLDAVDRNGQFSGNRMWLLERAKATENTARLAEYWLGEGVDDWAKDQTGEEADIEAWWQARNLLCWRVAIGDDSVTLSRGFG